MSNDNEKQLITVEQQRSTAVQLYGDQDDINQLAYAVQKVAPWAQDMSANEIGLAVRRATAMGLDPLNPHEVQIWKQGNQVQFQLAYTLMAEWVRHFYGQHTEPQFVELDEAAKDKERLDHSALAVRVEFIMTADIAKLQTLMAAGIPGTDARNMVTVKGIGVATSKELGNANFAPHGRTARWKVEKRALVDAYRRKFGTPTRDQITELRRAFGRDRLEAEDWVIAAEVSNGERAVIIQAAEGEAVAREAKERINGMSDEERADYVQEAVALLRREPQDDILDQPPAKTTWAEETFKAVINAKLADHEKHVAAMLGLSKILTPDHGSAAALEWARQYRKARESGGDEKQAAKFADKRLADQEAAEDE